MLERFASRVAVKTFAKWIPIIGTALSAGIGYNITVAFGEDLIDDCESLAEKVVESEAGAYTNKAS